MFKRLFFCGILLVASLGTSADQFPKPGWEDAYSKRNVRLGITLEEFRKLPFPDSSEYHYTIPEPYCSNDPIASDYIHMRIIGSNEAGLIKCGYYGTYTYMVNPHMKNQRLEMIAPLLLDWAPDTDYYFIKPESSNQYYLFKIVTIGGMNYDHVIDALNESIGPPLSYDETLMQNAFGATFPSKTVIWQNHVSKIVLMSNVGELGSHSIVYTLSSLDKINQAIEDKVSKESRKRL